MHCTKCGSRIAEGTKICEGCGNAVNLQRLVGNDDNRPIVGIAVAAIFGIVGLLWSLAIIFNEIYGSPGSAAAALRAAFPALPSINFFSSSIGMIGNSALLIGALLAFLRDPKGNKLTRITSYFMLLAIVGMFAASYFAVTGSDAWATLDAATRGSLISGLIGGMLGGFFQWGLVLYFFRKRRWG